MPINRILAGIGKGLLAFGFTHAVIIGVVLITEGTLENIEEFYISSMGLFNIVFTFIFLLFMGISIER